MHAGEQLWFLMTHGIVDFEREKLTKKYAYTLINGYQKTNRLGDIRFYQVLRFYKQLGIAPAKSLKLSQAKAETIHESMV